MVRDAAQIILHQRFRTWRLLAMVALIGAALVVSTDDSGAQTSVTVVKTDTSITLSWSAEGKLTLYWWQPAPARIFKSIDFNGEQSWTATGLQPESVHEFSFTGAFWHRFSVTTNAAGNPQPTPVVSIAAGANISEGGDATFTLTATPTPTQAIDVKISPLLAGDYGIPNAVKSVSIPTSGSATVTFSTTDDSVDEAGGSITASIVSGTGYTSSTTNGSATVAIADNDVPELSIASDGDVTEGTAASFTITASPTPHTALSVDVGVSASGSFGVTTGTQTISVPTSGSKTLTISTSGDTTDEPDGSVTVMLGSGTGYDVSSSAGSATAAISDDDVPPQADPEVSITAGSAITEGSDATFTISASPAPSATLDVSVTVSQTGAYASTGQQTVTIPTSGSYTLTVSTTNDSTDEPDGTVVATLDSGTGYTVSSSNGHATVAVSDDDDPPQPAQAQSAQEQISHCLTGNILQTVRGYYNSNKNKAPNYGENWKRVLIAFHDVQDATLKPYTAAEALQSENIWSGWKPVREAIQCIEIVFPAPSADPEISIAGSADVTEGSSVSFTVTATPAPSANLDVSVAVTQSGSFTTQTGTETVTIGTTGSTSFAISTDNDTTDEPDGSITATVDTGTGYTVSSSAGAVTVAVADDDDAPKKQTQTPSFRIIYNDITNLFRRNLLLYEDQSEIRSRTTLTFPIKLHEQPQGTVTVRPVVGKGWQTQAFVVNPETLTFTTNNWNVNQSFTVTSARDFNHNTDDVQLKFTIDEHPGATITQQPLHIIHSDDLEDHIEFGPADPAGGSSQVIEEGDPFMFRVRLGAVPDQEITVDLNYVARLSTSTVTITPSSLTFDSTNWKVWQTVAITAPADSDIHNNSAVFAIRTKINAYFKYYSVQHIDNDVPQVLLSRSKINLTEGSIATYTARLNRDPGNGVTVTVTPSSADSTKVSVSGALTFTGGSGGDWATRKSITVSALQDMDRDNHTVAISHQVSGFGNAAAKDVNVAVTDDDAVPEVVVSRQQFDITEGASRIYRVWLRLDPGDGKTVTVTPQFSGSDITVNPTSLSFTGGSNGNWNTKQSVTVASAKDQDPNNESVTISHLISGNGDGYNAQTLSQSVDVVVLDDESKVELEFDRDVLVLNEGDTSGVELKVRLTNDPGQAGGARNRVLVTTFPGGTWTYFRAAPDNLWFTTGPDGNWNEWQTFTFTPSGSNVDDGNTTHDRRRRYVVLGHLPIQNLPGYPNTVNDKVRKPIDFFYFDDEVAGELTLERSSMTIPEQGGAATYKLTLNSDPGGPVTVTISNPDPSKLKISPETVTFPYGGPGDWHIQEVTLTPIVDDDATEETLSIVHTYDGFGSTNQQLTLSEQQQAQSLQQQTLSLTITDPGEQLKLVYDTDDIYIEEQYGADVSGLTEAHFDTLRSGKFLPWSVLPRSSIPTDSHPTGSITRICMALNRDPEAHVRVVLADKHLTDGQGGTDTTRVRFRLDHPTSSYKTGYKHWWDFTSTNWKEQVCFIVTAGDDAKISHVDAQVTPIIERIWYPDPGRQASQTPASGIHVAAPSFRVRVFDNVWNRISMYPRGGGSTVNLTEGGASKKIRLEMVNIHLSNAKLTVNIPDEHKDAIRVTPSTVFGFPAWRTFDWGCSKFSIYRDEYCLDVTVTALPDNDLVDETIELSFTITGLSDVTTPTPNTITINVTDIASTPVEMEVGPSSLFMVEESISDDIWIRLKQDPVVDVDVTATVTTGDASKVRILPDKLTFDSSNYRTFQRLSVEALADSDSNNEAVTLTIKGKGAGLVIGDHTVEAEIIDDD